MAGRAAFARRVAEEVRSAVGTSMAVLAKWNMVDGFRGGLWLDESLAAARLLESDGTLDALVLTGGSSLRNPMYLFRGEAPVEEMAAAFPRPVRRVFRLVGPRVFRSYPFEEAYFLPLARQFRQALSMPLVLLGGVNQLQTARRATAEGFELVAMARALLREPGLVARWSAADERPSLCIHCNKCIPTIYRGTHCVLVPAGERPGSAAGERPGSPAAAP